MQKNRVEKPWMVEGDFKALWEEMGRVRDSVINNLVQNLKRKLTWLMGKLH